MPADREKDPGRGFDALLAVSEAIASPCSQRELVDRILGIVSRTFPSSSSPAVCSLRLLDFATGELYFVAGRGM